jgi:hypothetical protein
MDALDEGHKAQVKRGIGMDEPEPGKRYQAMERLAGRTRHLVIGTATPIQTNREEIWDLMEGLAYGQDHVLGRPSASRWWDAEQALDLIAGRGPPCRTRMRPGPGSAPRCRMRARRPCFGGSGKT